MKWLLGLIVLLNLQGSLWAQRQYKALPFPPYEIYEALLAYAEDANFEGIAKTLPYLQPLFAVLREGRGKDLESSIRRAVAAKDSSGAKAALLEMIFEDMLFNLKAAGAPRGIREFRETLQMAFMDYHFLSPAVRSADDALDGAVLREFKLAYRTGKSGPIIERAAKVESTVSAKTGPKDGK